jgi:ribonucleoside-diphosphate reductase alpha chain
MNRTSSAFNLPNYAPPGNALEVLIRGAILSEEEKPQDLLERVISTIFSVENEFGTQPDCIKEMAEELAEYMVEGYVMLGTPTLTNAGRHNMALSSCVVIPVNLQELNADTEELICSYYQQNMGSGFQFMPYDDPVALLSWINDLSVRETASGTYERYIGNMGLLHVSHPRIREFIEAKRHKEIRHFNISVDVTEDFMGRAENGMPFVLTDGAEIDAAELFQCMAENAWYNGDPGLIFLERMNNDNSIAEISRYVSTPPCAEMGLAEGETSQFGYINLHRFVKNMGTTAAIDYDKLERVTQLLTRALDNAIEYSLPRYPTSVSADIARLKRKMGIGVCGLADMLIALKYPYDSQEARNMARDVLSFINYISKCTSVALADQRGSCLAMNFPLINKYISGRFLEDKYMEHPTRTVSAHDWEKLAHTIRTTRKLRNISTTALAPTGRSSILLDVTSSIEPLFSIFDSKGCLLKNVSSLLCQELGEDEQILQQVRQEASRSGSFQGIEALPYSIRECLKTAKEIAPLAHLQMVAVLTGLQGVIDEAASKTVNLSHTATVDDVKDIFLSSFHLGLKNISIYRDKTKMGQPVQA